MKFSFQDIDKIITIVNNHINQVNIVFTNNKNKIYEFTCSLNHSESIQKIKDVCNNLVIPYQDKYLELLNEFLTALVALKQTYNDEVDYIDWDEEKLSTAHNDVELVKTHIQSIDDELNYCPHKGGFYLDMEAKTNNLKNDLCSLQRKIEKISNDLENFCKSDFFEYFKQEFNNLNYQNLDYAKNPDNSALLKEIDETTSFLNKYDGNPPNLANFDNYSDYLEEVLIYAVLKGYAKVTLSENEEIAVTFNDKFILSRYGSPAEVTLQIVGIKHNGKWQYMPIMSYEIINEKAVEDKDKLIFIMTIPNGILVRDFGVETDILNNHYYDFFSMLFNGQWKFNYVIDTLSLAYTDGLDRNTYNNINNYVSNSKDEEYLYKFFSAFLEADKKLNNPNFTGSTEEYSSNRVATSITDLVKEHKVHASGSRKDTLAATLGLIGKSLADKYIPKNEDEKEKIINEFKQDIISFATYPNFLNYIRFIVEKIEVSDECKKNYNESMKNTDIESNTNIDNGGLKDDIELYYNLFIQNLGLF